MVGVGGRGSHLTVRIVTSPTLTLNSAPLPLSPTGSSGFVPGTSGTDGTSGCTTDTNTHAGAVTATTQPPFYSSTLCSNGGACCAPGEYADPANGNAW